VRHLPILTVWSDVEAHSARTRGERVAAHNRAIAAIANREGLPITSVPVPAAAGRTPEVGLGREASADLLRKVRPPAPSSIAHWFLYPGQGSGFWLTASELRGELWEHEQLDILPANETADAAYITRVIASKMSHLAGTTEQNTITISTSGVAKLNVNLKPDLMDFTRPIRIVCNGIKRYDDSVQPSITTITESAYETWDFQRPAWARLMFAIRSDADPTLD